MVKRRHFLQTSLGAAAWTWTTLEACAQQPASTPARRLRIGFLGAVHSHGLPKVRLTARSPEWDLVGVSEQDPSTRLACEKLGVSLLSQAEILEKSEVVAVESSVPDHARHALLALKAGKHVHVEKPPADNLEDVREMIRLARAHGRVFQPGYMWRTHPGFQKIFEAVRAGWLGEIYSIRAHISNHAGASQRQEWGQFKGGLMFELGVHLLDPIVRLMGRPLKVSPFLRTDGPARDEFRDNNAVVLEFDRGMAVLLNSSLQSSKSPARSFEVLGTNGTATLRPIEPPSFEVDLVKAAGPYTAGRQTVPMPPYERYTGDFAELARAVRGEKPLSVTLDEELLVQETVLLASGM